jgi:hypothetical protein
MACTLPLKWLGLRRVPSAAPGMLNHTPRAFFRQTKMTHYCRRARRSSGVNDVGAGKSAVTDNIRCKRIANFRHGHDHALDVRPKVRTARMCDVAFWHLSEMSGLADDVGFRGHSGSRISGPSGPLLTRTGDPPAFHAAMARTVFSPVRHSFKPIMPFPGLGIANETARVSSRSLAALFFTGDPPLATAAW